MNLSKRKRWRAYRVIAKQTLKKRIDLSMCLHAAEKYGKVERDNPQND